VIHVQSRCFANSPSSLLKLPLILLSSPLLNGQSPCQYIPHKCNRDTVHNIQWSLTLLACTEEIKHFKINLSSYGYLALSPSLCKFWPKTLGFVKTVWPVSSGQLTIFQRWPLNSEQPFNSFIRWPVSFGLRCLIYLSVILNCQFFGRTEKSPFLKTGLNTPQFLCPTADKIGFLLLLPGKVTTY